jgi:hypothetical protein
MLPVNIDFDAAQQAWRANKVYLGQGTFRYKKTPREWTKKPVKKPVKKKINTSHNYNLRDRKPKQCPQ